MKVNAEIVKVNGELIDCGEVPIRADGTLELVMLQVGEPFDEARRQELTEAYRQEYPGYCIVISGPDEGVQFVSPEPLGGIARA